MCTAVARTDRLSPHSASRLLRHPLGCRGACVCVHGASCPTHYVLHTTHAGGCKNAGPSCAIGARQHHLGVRRSRTLSAAPELGIYVYIVQYIYMYQYSCFVLSPSLSAPILCQSASTRSGSPTRSVESRSRRIAIEDSCAGNSYQ